MLLNKSQIRMICCVSIVASVLAGCSRNEVKRKPTIPDSAEASSTVGKAKKKASRGSQYDTLWDRLFALYALPNIDHPDIDRELSWFANHPSYLERAQNRAEPFLYSIVKLVEKKKIPGELALLPIVESAFQPNVVSPAKAAGIWQFIPSTGSNYGLKRSHSYDGRRDVYASTKAAIKYLRKLHGDFGDWLLAIAAYNCGEGAVARAIRRNEAAGLPTDFWSLNLPQETRAYVPKLLAVARLFADAERYGIALKDLPNVARYKPVKINNQLDLALAADAAGISLEKLYELNPGFRGQFADVDGSFHLYIPADKKAADFRQEVERLSMTRRSYLRSDPYAEAESLPSEPDGAFQSFRREFSRNPPPPSGRITGGRYIPMSAAMPADAEPDPNQPAVERSVTAEPSRPARMASLARMDAGRSPAPTLAESVPVELPAALPGERSGRRMAAESRSPPPATRRAEPEEVATIETAKARPRPAKASHHEVQKGETLYAVARRYSLDVTQLAEWNNIPITTRVQAGQKLVVSDTQAARKAPAAGLVSAKAAGLPATARTRGSATGGTGPAKPAGTSAATKHADSSKTRVAASNANNRKKPGANTAAAADLRKVAANR